MFCIAAMKTMTAAIKGKKALKGAGIDCEIVSLDGNLTKNGCAYGLSYSCSQRREAEYIMQKNRVNYGEIIG
ncbi:MAG: DUF3343 domain-containing protein [Ruminococcaceae bacterium]|nr:DUF3343 domain-containing protein [Oscillospiraceae bacterium]